MKDRDSHDLNLAARGWNAHHIPRVCAPCHPTGNDSVPFGNQVLDCEMDIWKGSAIDSDELLPAGTQVKRGQAILNLLLLTPEKDLAGVREAVEVKKVQLEVAQAQADRAKLLLQDKATSEKIYLEAQAGLADG